MGLPAKEIQNMMMNNGKSKGLEKGDDTFRSAIQALSWSVWVNSRSTLPALAVSGQLSNKCLQ